MVSTFFVYRFGAQENRSRFEMETAEIIERIVQRFERYENSLMQARAFYQSSRAVSIKEFRDYFENTELIKRYPGLMGLGFTRKIEPHELNQHELSMRRLYPDYHVWPTHPRDVYFSIIFLEPFPVNEPAIGYDMFTESVRHEAMAQARDSGHAIMSGVVTLVQDDMRDPQPGFLIYLPVYEGGQLPKTKEERQKKLMGFIYSPFRSHDLFDGIFGRDKLDIDFTIAMVTEEGAISVYDAIKGPEQESKDHEATISFKILGRDFEAHFTSQQSFQQKSVRYGPYYIALSGLLLTLLLSRLFALSQNRAEFEKRSKELLAAEAARLRENQEALSKAISMRDEFISIASHELKTPLTALQLQLQLALRREVTQPERFRKIAELALTQVSRLTRLVEDLLDVTRIDAGKLTYEKKLSPLAPIVKETVERLEGHLTNSKCNLSLQVLDDVSAVIDTFRIEQVISNLLMNSAKYAGGSDVKVKLFREGQKAVITVEDTGPGIPSELHEKIFERFERAREQHTVAGLGLGLYIAKDIIIAHGGSLRVESKPGDGSRFIIELPLGG